MPLFNPSTSGITTVTTTEIVDGTIVNADINTSAAIAWSKIDKSGALPADIGAQTSDSDLTALAAQAGTNTFPVRTGVGTISEKTYLDHASYTPIVTLVGGAGNTVPVYLVNTGRWCRIGNRVFVDIFLGNDGGAEGAGTGNLTISLPVATGASNFAGRIFCGFYLNNITSDAIGVILTAGATTVALTVRAGSNLKGDDQNSTSRGLALSFSYEV